MKKRAMTVLEMLIAMSIIAVISALAINVLRVHISRDTDITKFKHAFGTLTQVIYTLRNDISMYPNADVFGNMDTFYDNNDNTSYGGASKFKKLFTSKFNVLSNELEINFGNVQVPLIKYKDESDNEYFKSASKIKCFIENKGFMFCPPETDVPSSYSLSHIYIPVYINKIDINNKNTTGIEKAIFVEVSNKGKIEIPPIVYYNKNNIIIDCINNEYIQCMKNNNNNKESCAHLTDYNSYNHCKVLDKMLDIDF